MSRFLLLLVFVLWMSGPDGGSVAGHGQWLYLVGFVGFYGILVMLMGAWSRWVASQVSKGDLQGRLRRFNFMMYLARLMVPGWFAVGVYFLGWKNWVDEGLYHTPLRMLHIDLPGLLMGSLPAFLAWMGLWWAQYPADRALREQSLLISIEQDLPVFAPPGFWSYIMVNFRLQLLFTIAPVLLLVMLRDGLSLVIPPLMSHVAWAAGKDWLIQSMISLPSFALIFVFGPELLRHVLHTESMPDSPLRRRLEAICQKNNIRYRDVLLWHTQYHMGNAAVMGFIPQVRYILLSDLLLETMSDEQIEAVFAHEVGHVMHRHLFWLAAAMAALMLSFAGPGNYVIDQLDVLQHRIGMPESVEYILILSIGVGLFSLVFGYISRHCERQADVFAARLLQNSFDHSPRSQLDALTELMAEKAPKELPGPLDYQAPSHVGQHGAEMFCSALHRVAVVNNIPIAARSWCHGSIASRMRFLNELGGHPTKTVEFDKSMTRIFVLVLFALCVFGVWAMAVLSRQ